MKLLFITKFDFTANKKDGGVLGTYRNYELLTRIYGEDNITVCILTGEEKKNKRNIYYFKVSENILKNYLDYLFLRDRIPLQVEKKVKDFILQQNIDFIFYDGSTFGQIIKYHEIEKIPNVVFFHNIERQYTWEQVIKHSPICIFRYWATRYNETKMVDKGEKVICLNRRDNQLLQKLYGRKADYILPVTFSDKSSKNTDNEEKKDIDLLYVGSYIAHNYTGLLWFIREVMPQIDLSLTIVGKDMEKLSEKVKNVKNVHIVGTVDNLDTYYLNAKAVVMPIYMGGGMKLKTAEAMMYGKTIFASKEALEGYEIDNVEGVYECNTAEEYIKSLTKFKESKVKIYNDSVRDLFEKKYCTDNYVKPVKDFLEQNETKDEK